MNDANYRIIKIPYGFQVSLSHSNIFGRKSRLTFVDLKADAHLSSTIPDQQGSSTRGLAAILHGSGRAFVGYVGAIYIHRGESHR
jgi:hypothetical protein